MKKAAIFLMALLVFAGVLLLGRLHGASRGAVLTASEGFWEYRLGQHPLEVRLPITTRVVSEIPGDGEMLFSASLKDDELGFSGYLQLWRVEDLDEFIAASKERSPFDFKEFTRKQVKLGDCEGFQVDWKALMRNNKPASGRDYLLRKGDSDEVLRLSFFSETASFSPRLAEAVGFIAASVEWK